MSLTSILMLIVGALAALFGGLAGHGLGKSSGRKEGASQAIQEQEIQQANATVQAVQERTHVEVQVAADSDDELDARLSKHDRPG